MANSRVTLILTGVSAVLGLLVLVGSSILIQDFMEWHKPCHKVLDIVDKLNPGGLEIEDIELSCKDFDWTMAAGSLGIIAAILQMIFCILAFIKRGDGPVSKIWPVAHIVVLVLTVAAFGIGIKFMGSDLLKEVFKLTDVSTIQLPSPAEWEFAFPGIPYPDFPEPPASLLVKAKYQFFNAAVGLDWIFCLLATIVYFVVAKK